MTIVCTNKECLGRIRVGRPFDVPTLQVTTLNYCPQCGSRAVARADNDEDYWETLANVHEVSVEAIKMIYDAWDRNECEKFVDHVNKLKKEAGW